MEAALSTTARQLVLESTLAWLRRHAFFLGWTLAAALIIGRVPNTILRPEFWAEDAQIFFRDAFENGWKSLWLPAAGYQMFSARVIALISTLLPIEKIPLAYAASSVALNATMASWILRPRFDWLLPRLWQRAIVTLALTSCPAAGEVYLNVSNSQFCLLALGFLILLETPATLSWKRGLSLFVIFLSTGASAILLPQILLQAILFESRRHARLACLQVMVLGALFASVHLQSGPFLGSGLPDWRRIGIAPILWLERAELHLLYVPWLGESAASIMRWPALVFHFVSFALFAIMTFRLKGIFGRWRESLLLLGTGLSASAIFGMMALVRTGMLSYLARPSAFPLSNMRYSFVVGVVAIAIWATVLLRFERGRAAWIARAAFFVILAQALISRGDNYVRPNLNWPSYAVAIQRALDDQVRGRLPTRTSFEVPYHPGSSLVTIELPRETP